MKLSFSKSDLKKHYDNAAIISDTAKQIIKDFALFGIQIEFPSEIKYAYQELYPQLEEQLEILLSANNSKILSLLYQIDIPEKVIQQKASSEPERLLSDVVTELIMDRELKKVLTRLYFKEHGF